MKSEPMLTECICWVYLRHNIPWFLKPILLEVSELGAENIDFGTGVLTP